MQPQLAVGERMGQRRQVPGRSRVVTRHRQRLGVVSSHRHTVQACPDAARRPPLQPDGQLPRLGLAQYQQPPALVSTCDPLRLHREPVGGIGSARLAEPGHRTPFAGGLPERAHTRPQVHEALGIGHHVVRRRMLGQQRLGQLPQFPLSTGLGEIPLEGQQTAEHPTHVAIGDGHPFTVTESRNRRGGGIPDARQGGQHRRRGREAPSVLGHHGAGAAVQVAGATVVPQPAPHGHHLVLGCRGEGMHIGKPVEEARVVAQDGAHLGLLQHDFGQPHAVGITGALPGQAMPPVASLPLHQGRCKTGAHRA